MTLKKYSFFFWFNLTLFLIVVTAFPLRALLKPENLPPIRLSLHIHAVSTGIWYFLILIQSYLVKKNKYKTHVLLGWISIALAIVLVWSGTIIIFEYWYRTDDFALFFGSILSLIMFSICYVLGIWFRKDLEFHKRIMVFASISCISPALTRYSLIFGIPFGWHNLVWIALALAIPFYDYKRKKKINNASKIGVMLLALIFLGMILFAGPPKLPAKNITKTLTAKPELNLTRSSLNGKYFNIL